MTHSNWHRDQKKEALSGSLTDRCSRWQRTDKCSVECRRKSDGNWEYWTALWHCPNSIILVFGRADMFVLQMPRQTKCVSMKAPPNKWGGVSNELTKGNCGNGYGACTASLWQKSTLQFVSLRAPEVLFDEAYSDRRHPKSNSLK